jgi:hypothetical protein
VVPAGVLPPANFHGSGVRFQCLRERRPDGAPATAAPKAEKTGGAEDDSEEDLPF